MRLVFFGTPLFAKDILEGLRQTHTILALITQPDKPFGRKKILKAPETKEYALAHQIPYFQPEKSIDIAPILDSIDKTQGIEAVIVVAYGKILKQEVVSRYMCFNLHGSLLPYYRGASPIQTSIMDNYAHFGLSVIRMDIGLDSGDIVAMRAIDTESAKHKNLADIFVLFVPYGVALLQEVLAKLQDKTLTFTPQNHAEATYCKKFDKEDCYLDFADSQTCYLLFLALGHIGTWTRYKDMILKINGIHSSMPNGIHEKRGIILAIEKDSALISCKNGALWIESVTPQNKAKMPIKSFLQSQGLKVGNVLGLGE